MSVPYPQEWQPNRTTWHCHNNPTERMKVSDSDPQRVATLGMLSQPDIAASRDIMIACIPPRRVDHPVESIIPQSRPFRIVDHGKSGEVITALPVAA